MKLLTKRILSMALTFCLCLTMPPAITMHVDALTPNYSVSSSYKASSYYSALCKVTLTGNQREDIVNVALSQVGYKEGSSSNDYSGADDGSYNNYTEYNYWYNKYVSSGMPVGGSGAPWCATFVSWCAEQANIPSSILKRSTAAGHGASYFNIKFYSGSSTLASSNDNDSYFMGYNYTPKMGDLFFTRSWSHVGLVVAVNGSYVTTVEGNTNNNGSSQGNGVYRLTSRKISDLYFGVPNYSGTQTHKVNSSYGTNFTAYPKSKITAENIFDANHNQISSSAWIGTSDKCTIHEVYTDGCCKVSYPLDSGGTKTVYSKISLFNTHTHNYTGARVYESEHPHVITQRCVDYVSCGGYRVTGEYAQAKDCKQCWSASFDLSVSSISIKVGESKTISATISGCWPDTVKAYGELLPDNGVVQVDVGQKQLTFKGLKAGTTNYKLTVYSDSSKTYLIGSKSIPVTVAEKGCESNVHSYSYKVTTKPTTSSNGALTGYCSKCSATTTVSLPILNTSNYNYTVTKATTCTTSGIGRYTWKTTTYGSFYFDVSISSTGHTYTDKVITPSCTAKGFTTHTCSCGDWYQDNYTNALGHSYSYKESKAPTVSATGTLIGTCSRCSGTTTITLPKLNTTDYSYKVMDQPTCTKTGTGLYILKSTAYGNQMFTVGIPETGHSYVDIVTAPTCTAMGYTTRLCFCGYSYKDAYTEANGHNYFTEWTIDTPATETSVGYKSHHCKVCGEKTDVTEIPKPNCSHNYGEWSTLIEPSCTGEGLDQRACTKCANIVQRTLSKLDHDYATEWTVDTLATATTAGSKSRHCKRDGCDVKTDVTVIPATGAMDVTETFTDVKSGAWYVSALQYAVDHNLFNGIAADRFAPDMAMNRAMLVTVLWRMEGQPLVSAANPFNDVPAGEWYSGAVLWASSNGIVDGIGNGKFAPMENITREQMATILYRYAGKKGYDLTASANLNAFPDGAKTADYAKTALAWAYGEVLITGADGKLLPQGGATRAQVATILMRYQNNIAQ